ncbi:MAG TPA: hypothetical protein ENI56_02675 [Candidatus Kaiserbacteria bacterium]|nr:hypothetical protein [Candidatus Kaiserbacteria bacterium]
MNDTVLSEPKKTHPRFVRWALLIAIVIVLNIFFFVFQQNIFPSPKYDTYCPQPTQKAFTEKACVAQQGVWNAYPPVSPGVTSSKSQITGYCDYYASCQPKYESARSTQHLYAFALLMVLGITALVIGFMPIGSSIVSSGLSYGGVLALLIASMQYWSDAGSLLRLGISAVALAILIYVGMRSFKDAPTR